jgi:hypothetical protein
VPVRDILTIDVDEEDRKEQLIAEIQNEKQNQTFIFNRGNEISEVISKCEISNQKLREEIED